MFEIEAQLRRGPKPLMVAGFLLCTHLISTMATANLSSRQICQDLLTSPHEFIISPTETRQTNTSDQGLLDKIPARRDELIALLKKTPSGADLLRALPVLLDFSWVRMPSTNDTIEAITSFEAINGQRVHLRLMSSGLATIGVVSSKAVDPATVSIVVNIIKNAGATALVSTAGFPPNGFYVRQLNLSSQKSLQAIKQIVTFLLLKPKVQF